MVQRAIDQVSSYFRSGSAAPAQPTARPARNAEQQPASAPRTAGAGITAALRNLFDRLFSVATPNAPRLSAAPTVRDTPELAAAQINVPGAMEPHLYEAELSAYAGKLDKACAAMASGDPAKALAILKGARSDLAALGVACEAAGGNLSNGGLSGLAMKQLAPSLAPAKLYALKVIVDTVGKELQGALASALGAAMDKAPPDAVQCRELRESASDLAAFTQSMDGMAVKITGGTSEVARNARSSAASLLKSLGQNAKALLGSTSGVAGARCEKAIQAVLSELTQPLETDAGNFSDLTLRDSCRSRFSGVDTQGKAIELSLKGARDDAVFEAGVTACLGGDQQLAKDVSRLINQDLAAGLIEKLSHTFGGAGSPFELNGQSIIPLGSPEAHFNLSMVDGQASVQVRLVYGEDARNLPDQTELSSDSRGELNFEIRMAPDGTPRLEGPVLFVSRVKERQAHLTELAKMDTNALTKMYQQEAPQRTRDGARTQLLRDIGAQLQSRALGNASAQYEAFSTVGDATKELTALAERAVASSQAVPAGPLDDATPISKAVVVDLNRKMDVRVLGDDGAVSKLLDDPPAGDAPSKATQYAQAFASKLQLTGTASLALSAVMGQSAHLSIERAWRESATRCDAGPGNLGLSPRNQSSTLTLQSDGAGGVYARFDTHKNVDGIVAPGAQVPTLVKPGSHIKTRLELHVGANGVVTQPEPYTYSTNLAGFAFT